MCKVGYKNNDGRNKFLSQGIKMVERSFAWCKNFESIECPNINSQIMQKIFSPNSIYKGDLSNIADDWDILDALDTCTNCNKFEYK